MSNGCSFRFSPQLTLGLEDHGFGPISATGPDADLLAASKLRGSLPEPRMNSIPEIDRIIKILSRATAVKEKMCEWMQREVLIRCVALTPPKEISIQGYIISLIEVFTKSEDLESLNDLHALCRCMQTICKFLFNVRFTWLTVVMPPKCFSMTILFMNTFWTIASSWVSWVFWSVSAIN